jgi:hypothetical protein
MLKLNEIAKLSVGFVADSKLWNKLLSNPFSIGILVSICILFIILITYNEENSKLKNIITFMIYATVFNTIAFAVHDMIKEANENVVEGAEEESEIANVVAGSDLQRYDSSIIPVPDSNYSQQQMQYMQPPPQQQNFNNHIMNRYNPMNRLA